MINTKQIIVIAGVVVLMGFVLAQPVKSLTKEDTATTESAGAPAAIADQFTLETVSQIAKQSLNASLVQEINNLEDQLNTASDADKLPLYKDLAQRWIDVNQTMPAAFIYEEIAKQEPNLDNWVTAGDFFTESYQNLNDTIMTPALTEHAKQAYE